MAQGCVNYVSENILSYIGNTPVIALNKIAKEEGLKCQLVAKCEFFSAGGSLKDRLALRMILSAEQEGKLVPGKNTIIAPTSGNFGIAVALVAAVKGYRTIITLPDRMSKEKISVMTALGATVIPTVSNVEVDSPKSHIGLAKKLCEEDKDALLLDQYADPANPLTHELDTAEEILRQVGTQLDVVVAGVGTGGTVTGLAKGLRRVCKDIVGVDPHGSIMAQPDSLNVASTQFEVEGIGHSFLPDVLDRQAVSQWIKTTDQESFQMSRRLIRTEGLMCGGSSGAVVVAAIKVAKELQLGKEKTVLVVLPDTMRNYLSKFLDEEWMDDHGFAY